MEKKMWSKPEVSVVEFQANEYVTACANTAPTGSGYLVLETNNEGGLQYSYSNPDIGPGDEGFDDTVVGNSATSLGAIFPNDPDVIASGYLDYVSGAAKADSWQSDQLLAHGSNNATLWEGCNDHSHSPGSAKLYDGYFYSSDSTAIPESSDGWSSVKLWLQSMGDAPGLIHAVLSDTARS